MGANMVVMDEVYMPSWDEGAYLTEVQLLCYSFMLGIE
jgi:hypothetical protein